MTIKFKSMTRVVSWLMAFSLALTFALPVEAIEFFPTPFRFEWSAQSGTLSADGTAHEYTVSAGDTVNMSLSVTNRSTDSRALVMYGIPPGGNLLPEVAPYRGAHELRIGVKNDEILPWLDASSFIENLDGDNNRLSVYDGVNIHPGSNVTFNWDVKIADDADDGIYEMNVSMVREFDAWATNINGGDIFWRFNIGDTSYVPPVAAGALNVSISSATPASDTVPKGGNANFTRFTLTAASGTTVNISKLYITRGGLSTDSEVENVKLLDANLIQQGSTAGGFNANHKAQLYFSPALEITGSMDFYIRAGFASLTGSSVTHTAKLGIAENTDIVSNASSTAGAPVWGSLMTVIDVIIGSLTLKEDGSMTDTTPDVGDTNLIVNTFKLVNDSSTEEIVIEQITANKAGSADTSDTANIELWDVTNNVSLGEVASWNSSSKAVFPVSITLAKGQTVRYRIQLDIIDGSSLTVNADLVDGSDVLIFAKGLTYGYYITPSCTAGSDWTLDSGTGGTNNKGQGDKNQTINKGSITITRSSSTPATGYIAVASDQKLGVFDWEVKGEEMQITAVDIDLQFATVSAATYTDLTNAVLLDASGNILAGPVDGKAVVTDDNGYDEGTFDFNDTFTLPVGTNELTVTADLSTDWVDTDTIQITIAVAADVTAKGLQTGDSVVPTVTGATSNVMTVKAGALVVETLGNPATSNVIVNASDLIIGTYSFNAVASGEDVNVTSFTITDTFDGTTGEIDDFESWQLWADLTDANHATRGDKYETAISDIENESGAAALASDTITFSLTTTLLIPKGEIREIAAVADVASGATVLGTHTIETIETNGSICTATGKDTGSDIEETYAGTSINAILTIATVGSMKTTLWDGSPESALIIASTSDNVLGGATFTATDEAFNITKLTMDLTGYSAVRYLTVEYPTMDNNGVAGTDDRTVSVSSAVVIFDGIEMHVPKNNHATAKFTVETWGITSAPGSFRDTITLVLDTSSPGDFVATGDDSGSALAGDDSGIDDVTMASMYLHKTTLVVSSDNAGLSRTISPGAVLDLYKFKVTADSAGPATIKALTYQVFITDSSTTTNSAADLTNFTFLKDTGSGFVDITSTSQITSISVDGGSNYLDPPLTLEATNFIENNTSTWVQVTFNQTPVTGGEQTIDANATIIYLLRAEAGTGFTTNDAISVSLLGDTSAPTTNAFYLNDVDTGTGVEQIIALQTDAGATDWADVEFIWSDKSVLNHLSSFDDTGVTETSSADWTNGYLVKNFPVSSFGLTL